MTRRPKPLAGWLAGALLIACNSAPAGALPPLYTQAAPANLAPALPTLPSTWTPPPPAAPAATWTRPATLTASPTPTVAPTRTLTPTPLPGARSVIGASVEGRPLEVYQFGSGPVERLIVADIHGGAEWNTAALADELILHLNAHPELIPGPVTLFILRSLNPDGLARGHTVDGQMNAHGVDLNRNWPDHWLADWPRSGCWTYRPVTGGSAPLSEPETRALADFIQAHSFSAALSYHSAALGIFPGGYGDDRPALRLAEAVAAVSPYAYPPIDTGCLYTGEFADWASDNGVPALDIELTNHLETDFAPNLSILNVFLNWRP